MHCPGLRQVWIWPSEWETSAGNALFFPPPAALEVHRVVQVISVDFRAGSCSSAGKTLLGQKHGAWRTDVQSSFPLPCSAARLPGAGLKMSSSLRRGPLTKQCQACQVPCSWAFRRISLSRGARSLPSDGAVLQPPLRPDPAGEVGTTGSEGKAAHGSFCRPRGRFFPMREVRSQALLLPPRLDAGAASRWPGHATDHRCSLLQRCTSAACAVQRGAALCQRLSNCVFTPPVSNSLEIKQKQPKERKGRTNSAKFTLVSLSGKETKPQGTASALGASR